MRPCERLWLLLVLILFFSVGCQSGTPGAEEAEGAEFVSTRPNIIMIVVDDLRFDELGVTGHPYLETPHIDALAAEGAMFNRAFHSVPLCSPNRATILTGQYPSRHGIVDNVSRARASHNLQTFPQELQRSGYETAFLGKWHMGNDPTPRPGWDYWVAIPGQGRSTDPELFEEGGIHEVPGYLTDVLTDRAEGFITRDREGPFFLYIGHKAIHPDIQQLDDGSAASNTSRGYVPAPRHRGRYANRQFPLRPNAVTSLDDLSGKPALQRALRRKHETRAIEDLQASQKTIRDRAEMLLAVDDSVGRLVELLRESGELDNTAIIFTSDNGFWYGEHGMTVERRLPYEEGSRTPLLIRYPSVAAAGSQYGQLVGSVDLAPTALELAGAEIGSHIQGASLVRLMTGQTAGWRDALLIDFYTYENPFPWLLDMDYKTLRTDRYKYIHWMQHPDEGELYDLQEDPYEMRNVINHPQMAAVREELRQKLQIEVIRAVGLD